MRTVQSFLNDLPDEYRVGAINSIQPKRLNDMVSSPYDALCSFVWQFSPQGHDYWSKVARSLRMEWNNKLKIESGLIAKR